MSDLIKVILNTGFSGEAGIFTVYPVAADYEQFQDHLPHVLKKFGFHEELAGVKSHQIMLFACVFVPIHSSTAAYIHCIISLQRLTCQRISDMIKAK